MPYYFIIMLLPIPDTRATWAAYGALLALVALLFFAGLADLPLDTHDGDYFRDSADALADPAAFFAADKRMPGRPVLELVMLLQYAAWGTNVAAYHLFSGLLHCVAAFTLARAARALGLDLACALLTGLLFLVNVSHFNAVHWISAQCYPLVLICSSLALAAHLRGRTTTVYALLVAGALCHIAAAAFLPFFLYMSWRRGEPIRLRRYLPLGALLAALILALKLGYPQAPQATIAADGFDPLGMASNQLICWSRLFSTAHWLPHPLHRILPWEWVIGAAALIACAALQWRYHFPTSPWLTWIFVHLLPTLLLSPDYIAGIPSGPSRYLYLASAGVAGLIAWAMVASASSIPRSASPLLALPVILVCWTSYLGLQTATAITHYAAGRHYLADSDIARGIEQLARAIDTAPSAINLEDAYMRLVPMLYNQGRHDADRALAAALDRFPQNHTLLLVRLALDSLGPVAAAESARQKLATFKKSPGVSRLIAELYFHIGRGRQQQSDRTSALVALRRSLAFNPVRVQTHQAISEALAMPAQP